MRRRARFYGAKGAIVKPDFIASYIEASEGKPSRLEYEFKAPEFSAMIAAIVGVECDRVLGRPRVRITDAGDVTFIFDLVPPNEAATATAPAVKPLDSPGARATKEMVPLAVGGKY